jgi:hypothetical protein
MSCEPGCPTCQRLREAALELVGEGGIEALYDESLAGRAGLCEREVGAHYAEPGLCLYETYEEVTCSFLLDLADAFSQGSDFEQRLENGRSRLLGRIAAKPGEARLVFIESMRDPVLRQRRAINRRWIIEYLSSEHKKRHGDDGMTPLQFELMIGAGFQMIANALSEGAGAEELEELDARLAELGSWFVPTAA